MQYNAKKKEMGDRIDDLPVDHILPSKEEREILNTLYDNDEGIKGIKDIRKNINNNINNQQRPILTSPNNTKPGGSLSSQEKKESYDDDEEEEHYQGEEYRRQVVKKPIKNNGKTTLYQEVKLTFFLGLLFLVFNSNYAHQWFEKMLPLKFRTEIFCSGLKCIAFTMIVFITMNWGRTI
jgi:hypothetical protein